MYLYLDIYISHEVLYKSTENKHCLSLGRYKDFVIYYHPEREFVYLAKSYLEVPTEMRGEHCSSSRHQQDVFASVVLHYRLISSRHPITD